MPRSPVLLLVFNRPQLTERVMQAIRAARPPRLYVAADGPRPDRPGEDRLCAAARAAALQVDWPCEVETLLRDRNLGCKRGVSEAISWFFSKQPAGIILEDDCVPHADFFTFCDAMLERYADDPRVWTITGDNFQQGHRRGEASYYFSRYNHCWGWAGWRRAWQHYDGDISFWHRWRDSPKWAELLPDAVERGYWEDIFDRVANGDFDSWAYPWTASVWHGGGLTVTPAANLVENIGIGGDTTHTHRRRRAQAPGAVALTPLVHASEVRVNAAADRFTFDRHFGGRDLRWPRKLVYLGVRWLRSVLRHGDART